MLLADVDALVNDIDAVRDAVSGLALAAPEVAQEWATHLRALLRRPDLWECRVERAVIVELLRSVQAPAAQQPALF